MGEGAVKEKVTARQEERSPKGIISPGSAKSSIFNKPHKFQNMENPGSFHILDPQPPFLGKSKPALKQQERWKSFLYALETAWRWP